MIRGTFVPGWFNTLRCYFKYRSFVSPRAEVDVSPLLSIGEGSRISSFSQIKARHGELRIGRKAGIGVGCSLSSGEKGLTIGDNCLLGPYVIVVSINYRYDRLDIPFADQGWSSKGIEIGNNVWIGASSVILDGTTIGDNVIVAAGSVVSGRISDNAVIQGNPAREVFRRR